MWKFLRTRLYLARPVLVARPSWLPHHKGMFIRFVNNVSLSQQGQRFANAMLNSQLKLLILCLEWALAKLMTDPQMPSQPLSELFTLNVDPTCAPGKFE
jgi:hypothetical protein